MKIFRPAKILIPHDCDMTAWSVVACDQFTSDISYWEKAAEIAGNAPSTLNMILPEAYLSIKDPSEEREKINAVMSKYLREGVFDEYDDAYIIVERQLADGSLRRGIVGVIDLEQYEWTADSTSPVRATEHTVEDRLPPRVKVREKALLELPHIMLFIDDPSDSVMSGAEKGQLLYDFDLMQGGGHIRGWLAKNTDALEKSFERLGDKSVLESKYGTSEKAIVFAMGDGNHSIAAAKKYWNSVKQGLTPEECENHPARFALVEVINIHDPAIVFEPIHKAVFDTDVAAFISEAENYMCNDPDGDKVINIIAEGISKTIRISGLTIGELIGKCEEFCKGYIGVHGGYIDYIHGDDECLEIASRPGCAAIMLPSMNKSELFTSVMQSGPFPKKSFSIGVGPDKRYYLECRKIK